MRKSTPVEIVDKLNQQITVTEPKMKTRLTELAAAALTGSRDDLGKFLAVETEKWGRVIRAAHIKPD